MAKAKKSSLRIKCHLVSETTGSLAWQIIRAVTTQFPSLKVEMTAHTFTDSPDRMDAALKKIRGKNVWVFHALLDQDLRNRVEKYCAKQRIPSYDMANQLLDFFAKHSGQEPINDPNLELDEEYFRKLDALEFTLQHDDSRRLESIGEADIILVGLSRVSKTPTSCYLGSLGLKVANVSLVPEIGLPKELKRGMKKKVVALSMQPKRLQQIRARRMSVNKFDEALAANTDHGESSYMNLKDIIREVMSAESLYRERDFPIIDITDQAVEATATTILETLGIQRPFT